MAELRLDLGPGPGASREARRALAAAFPDLPPERGEDLALLVSELVMNSVVHASLESQDPIGVLVRVERGALRVEVSDRSPRVARLGPSSSAGGFGLNLVAAVSDRWGAEIRDGRNMTWFEIDGP